MDFTPIILQVFGAIGYLIPLAILAVLFKSSWFKGLLGEFIINLMSQFFLPKETYQLFKNVTLSAGDAYNNSGTTQIDHIIVSHYGVFVIETKNMKGWIFGQPNQKQWTQTIYKRKDRFQNPLHQNYKHVKTLEACLDIPLETIHSVVIFVGEARFKTPMPSNVIYASGYVRYIKSKQKVLLTEEQVDDITNTIESERLQPNHQTHRAHVQNLTETRKRLYSDNNCPKCGGGMVRRITKRGSNAGNSFWGCSSYPACKGIRPIT